MAKVLICRLGLSPTENFDESLIRNIRMKPRAKHSQRLTKLNKA